LECNGCDQPAQEQALAIFLAGMQSKRAALVCARDKTAKRLQACAPIRQCIGVGASADARGMGAPPDRSGPAIYNAINKKPAPQLAGGMVGATGIEPVTPTMSR
jgi:hypothetical protein